MHSSRERAWALTTHIQLSATRPHDLGMIDDHIRRRLHDASGSANWEVIQNAGRLVMTPDGGPIRSIVTGRRHIVTGSYPSRKAGRPFPHEGMNELDFFMHSEVDTTVVDYRAQPFRLEFVLDGRKRIYIADCIRLLETGSLEVVEIKNDRRFLRDQDYTAKIERAREICQLLGWDFRIITGAELRNPAVRHANIKEIQSRRNVSYGEGQVYAAANCVEQAGGEASLGNVAAAIAPRPHGQAIAKAMMVGRVLNIDLGPPLGSESAVRMVRDRTALSLGREVA
jgi:hypothetical protein